MSKAQRAQVDAILRQPRPTPRTVEEMRAGYAATQAQMAVPEGIRTGEATLGDRRALVVEPVDRDRPGTCAMIARQGACDGQPHPSVRTSSNAARDSLTRSAAVRARRRAVS